MMPRQPPRGPCPSPASPDWSSIRRSLPPASLSRSHGRARVGTTSTSTSSRSTAARGWQLTDDARRRPCGQRGRPTVNASRSCVSWTGRRRRLSSMPALGGPEQRLFEAGPECGGWSFGSGRMGSRGRRTASTWSSAIGVAPVPRRQSTLYSFEDGRRRQLTRPPTNLSDIHPVVSPDGRYLAFVRMNP